MFDEHSGPKQENLGQDDQLKSGLGSEFRKTDRGTLGALLGELVELSQNAENKAAKKSAFAIAVGDYIARTFPDIKLEDGKELTITLAPRLVSENHLGTNIPLKIRLFADSNGIIKVGVQFIDSKNLGDDELIAPVQAARRWIDDDSNPFESVLKQIELNQANKTPEELTRDLFLAHQFEFLSIIDNKVKGRERFNNGILSKITRGLVAAIKGTNNEGFKNQFLREGHYDYQVPMDNGENHTFRLSWKGVTDDLTLILLNESESATQPDSDTKKQLLDEPVLASSEASTQEEITTSDLENKLIDFVQNPSVELKKILDKITEIYQKSNPTDDERSELNKLISDVTNIFSQEFSLLKISDFQVGTSFEISVGNFDLYISPTENGGRLDFTVGIVPSSNISGAKDKPIVDGEPLPSPEQKFKTEFSNSEWPNKLVEIFEARRANLVTKNDAMVVSMRPGSATDKMREKYKFNDKLQQSIVDFVSYLLADHQGFLNNHTKFKLSSRDFDIITTWTQPDGKGERIFTIESRSK